MSALKRSTPRCAMVLAAGLGTRMRPLTDTMPKPLVKVAGKPLIDHVLDRLAAADVEKAVVNVHHFADQLIEHLGRRPRPQIVISDERGLLLGTGGGVRKALAELGDGPFFHINSDTIWIDGIKSESGSASGYLRSRGDGRTAVASPRPTEASATPAVAISRWRRMAAFSAAATG